MNLENKITKKIKVAKILDSHTLVLNVGSNDNVSAGMAFHIVDRFGPGIKDPDTGSVLGFLPISKGYVYTSEIFDRYTIVKSKYHDEKISKRVNDVDKVLHSSLVTMTPGYYEELNIDYNDISDSPDSDAPIKVGDTAQLVD
jgi:hypothetical protein